MLRRRTFLGFGLTAVGALVVSCAGGTTAPAAQNSAPVNANAPVSGGNVAVAPAVAPVAPTATQAAAAAPVAPTATQAAAAAAPAATAPVVKMTDQYKFDPATLTIPKGTTVEWQVAGTQPHTVTDDPSKAMDKSHTVLPAGADPWDSGMLNPGQSFKHTFTVAGEYSYICIPHEAMGMIGKITVT
jgi:plastocyanin